MPLYKFKNTKTGRVYEKLLTFAEHDEHIKKKNTIQIPTGFRVANLIHPNENKIREQLWTTAQAGKAQADYKDYRR